MPNGNALADYIQVNLAVSQKLDLPITGKMEARLDVINLFDKVYEIPRRLGRRRRRSRIRSPARGLRGLDEELLSLRRPEKIQPEPPRF